MSMFHAEDSGGMTWVYPTHLDRFQKCGYDFYLSNVMKIRGPPTGYMAVGTIFDNIITDELQRVIDGGSMYADAAENVDSEIAKYQELNPETDWDGAGLPIEKASDYLKRSLDFYMINVAPTIKPAYVQKKLELQIADDIMIAGYLDIIEEDGFIRDTKMSKNKKRADQISFTQAVFYSLLVEHGGLDMSCAGFQYDYIVYGGSTPFHDPRLIAVGQSVVNQMVEEVKEFVHARRAGVFPKTSPGNWYCSSKWCGQWSRCRGADQVIHQSQ